MARSPYPPHVAEMIREGCAPKVVAGPDIRGRYRYGDWWIIHEPPPIPWRGADWQFWHDDFDGPEDGRCGYAGSLEAVLNEIDEREADARQEAAA